MSFNIRGTVHADGDNVWPNRAALNVETIQKIAPDIIGFQELMVGNKAAYDAALDGYDHRLGPRVSMENRSGNWEHPAIYWQRDRFALVDAGDLYLSETPDHYAVDWGADQGRGLTWVQLRDRVNQRTFVFMNTHFDHVSNEARVKSAQLVSRKHAEMFPSLPVILTGDFNTMPLPGGDSETAYSTFMHAGFQDAFAVASPEDAAASTFHGFQGPAFRGFDGRIDWVLYHDPTQQLAATSLKIVRDAVPPLYPSDHYPLVATFDWR